MEFTKEKIITEVCETLCYVPSEKEEDIYIDTLGSWGDKSIEELIIQYVQNEDDYYMSDKIDHSRAFIYDFCVAAKELFYMGSYLNEYIERYKVED